MQAYTCIWEPNDKHLDALLASICSKSNTYNLLASWCLRYSTRKCKKPESIQTPTKASAGKTCLWKKASRRPNDILYAQFWLFVIKTLISKLILELDGKKALLSTTNILGATMSILQWFSVMKLPHHLFIYNFYNSFNVYC